MIFWMDMVELCWIFIFFGFGETDHGSPNLSTFMVDYRVGDIVDIKANSSQQKGMPHKCKLNTSHIHILSHIVVS